MRYLIVLYVSACLFFPVFAGQQWSLSPNDHIPVDPAMTTGRLENGLYYFIKANQKPENRAELRLVVNAGSVLEDDDQQGLAHFAEHMAFNGTENFAEHELVDYLESIGMKFGPEINAYTSFDETVYMLHVPTDSAEIMQTAFQILKDWASAISFEAEEIDKERGVIIEEWRLGRGANARMRDEQFPVIFKNSRYAERLPIGKKEIIKSFEYETLRRFYRDWYRPNLMAVIAVGDFDVDDILNRVRETFAGVQNPTQPRERTVFPVPDHEETLFAIATDPEATGSSVAIYYKMDLEKEETVADYRRVLVENIYNAMLNQRLYELIKQSDPPFLGASSGKGRFVRSKEIYYLGAGVKDNGIERGLDALLTESLRVKKFGFTQSELERVKRDMMRSMERAYKERDKTPSRRYASEYARHFLTGEPIPGIEYEYEIYKKYLPGVRLQEVNELAGEWISDNNRVIVVDAPEKPDVSVPAEDDLLAVFKAVENKQITPYVDTVSDEPLVKELPEPGTITGEKYMQDLDVTELTLSNGVRIVLKPTDFKNDEIRFRAFSPGGHSLISDSLYVAGVTAVAVVTEAGVGPFNDIELEKKLAGTVARVSPYIGSYYEGLSGSASPQDLETMFQLIYLYMTAPRKDREAFMSYQERMKGYIENRSARPETAFQDTIQVTMAQHHHRARPWTLSLLEEMDLDISYRFYRQRFADAGDFIFFFVGNFEVEKIKPMLESYLGCLPSLKRDESRRDLNIDPPAGIVKKTVRKGIEPKSRAQIMFTGPYDYNRHNNYNLEAMIDVLNIKLREVIREDKSGTYGVRVRASKSDEPENDYRITISFGTAPERVEELTRTIFEHVDSLRTTAPKQIYIDKVTESHAREYEVGLKENSFWLGNLVSYYQHETDPAYILAYENLYSKLDAETVRETAQKYFDMDNYVHVVLLPLEEE